MIASHFTKKIADKIFFYRWEFLSFLLIIAYFFLRLPFFLVDAFVPDEAWHTGYMNANKNDLTYSMIKQINYQGFGAIYWIFGSSILRIFPEPEGLFVLRYICFFSYLLATFSIFFFSASLPKFSRLLVLVCWLSLPMSWWSHKMIMPEMIVLAPLSFAAYLFIRNKEKFSFMAWIILGFCFGIKLNVAPCLAFLGMLFFGYNNFSLQKIYKILPIILLAFIAGFIIANPFLLLKESQSLFKEISSNGSYALNFTFWNIVTQLNAVCCGSVNLSWDLVPFGGMNENIIPIFSLIAVLYLVLRGSNLVYRLALLVSLGAFILMVLINRWVSYYAFPFMLVLFWSFDGINPTIFNNSNSKKAFNIIMTLAILANLARDNYNYQRDIGLSISQENNIKFWQGISDCAKPILAKSSSYLIVDNSEVGINAKRRTMLDFEYLRRDIKWIDDKFKQGSFQILHTFLEQDIIRRMQENKQNKILIINGKRLEVKEEYKYLPYRIINFLGSDYIAEVTQDNSCGNLQFIFLKIQKKPKVS